MKIKIVKQTFVKGQLAMKDDIIDATENDANLLVGMGKAVLVKSESAKKPENKAVKKKSIFSRKK